MGTDVSHVLVRVAGRPGVIGQDFAHAFFLDDAAIDQFEIVDQHTFLIDMGGAGRGAAWSHAANVGMVATGGCPEQDLAVIAVVDRRYNGDIGKVGSAIIGGVQNEHIAGIHIALVVGNHRSRPSDPSSPDGRACVARLRQAIRPVRRRRRRSRAAP